MENSKLYFWRFVDRDGTATSWVEVPQEKYESLRASNFFSKGWRSGTYYEGRIVTVSDVVYEPLED